MTQEELDNIKVGDCFRSRHVLYKVESTSNTGFITATRIVIKSASLDIRLAALNLYDFDSEELTLLSDSSLFDRVFKIASIAINTANDLMGHKA